MFVIGGLSGVTHSVVPSDYQQTDTYYVVAHFHYVIFGGSVFAFFGAFHYWWPKVFGRQLSEALGKVAFWTLLIGFNLTFGPMHILGLQGMSRRIYTYSAALGLGFWNFIATIGAFTIAVSILVFIVNVILSFRRPADAGPDPWDARTIEWSTSSPPPAYNFDEVPTITHLDDFWHRKYAEDDEGEVVPVPAGGALEADGHEASSAGHAIHLPGPSYYPIIASLGFLPIAYGTVFGGRLWLLAGAGGVLLLAGLFGWALEPSAE
jgi:cytochrome c oxidase subunit I